MADDPPTSDNTGQQDHISNSAADPWGSAVARFVGLRRLLNCWRLRTYVEDGLRVEYYATRRGIIVTSVKAVVA